MSRHTIQLQDGTALAEWRRQARLLLRAGVAPQDVQWLSPEEAPLFPDQPLPAPPGGALAAPRVPPAFIALAEDVLAHSDRQRHALLYRLLWRITQGERDLLQRETDLDVVRAHSWARAVQREVRHMQAFVRFRAVLEPGQDPVYVAWFEPAHPVLARAAPFFARRFAALRWAILTPAQSVHWDGRTLRFGPGATRAAAPAQDRLEDLWRTYYAHVFNPARLNPALLRSHLPVRYWKNLPEATLIPELVREAPAATEAMLTAAPAATRRRAGRTAVAAARPASASELNADLQACRRCALWAPATQAVPGQGPMPARVMLVGEQPGDREDLDGRPFVGPAGQLLDEALSAAELQRDRLYVTNAVKHFKFQPRGKRRLHQTASAREQAACLPWLERELALVQPGIVVALGAVATQALLGRGIRLGTVRGEWQVRGDGPIVLPTVHPSFLLRIEDPARREEEYLRFVADLRQVAQREAALAA